VERGQARRAEGSATPFRQHTAGTLEQAAFDSYCAGVRTYMSFPGFRAAWKLSAAQFGKEFRAFVDAHIAVTPLAPDVDLYTEWQRVVHSELGARIIDS
jgi:hypothetical protein